ncbi:transcriptional regulator [Sinobacterium caligoides]|uniref:Transcriptional regulator n=1 Tax=Sinobacterium caligoides TaxID=933926 RepID=A0A3N2DMW0_9GAMM|nr:GPR1/FUN34/YaaH family transporter [Sinobacterium caligoides]ROS01144.1 transcriptional regulator [Sinobacterium caligoides]
MSTKLANPAPLGLMGFGMTTILLNLHNAGFFSMSAIILSMGIFYGGVAQVMAGLMSFKRGETFGTTAFTSYGMFWLTLAGIIMMPQLGLSATVPAAFMGWFLSLWGLFTFCMFLATFRYPRAKQVVFGSLTLLFALLAVHDFTGSASIGRLAGYVGIFCGSSAIYFAMATVINGEYGRSVLPVGEVKRKA